MCREKDELGQDVIEALAEFLNRREGQYLSVILSASKTPSLRLLHFELWDRFKLKAL